jgi:signal transduction histidine kinase
MQSRTANWSTLAELRERQEDLLALTRELEDTNRGIVALYAEIEDKAERLRRADEMKSRFLSNTSHELRTPLSSIRALAKLLLDRMDGDLTSNRNARSVSSKPPPSTCPNWSTTCSTWPRSRPARSRCSPRRSTWSKPVPRAEGHVAPAGRSERRAGVRDARAGTAFDSDEGKVAQMLRNFISNALKFTEQRRRCVCAAEADPTPA